jgi:hypothetical protein
MPDDPFLNQRAEWRDITPMFSEYDEEVNVWGHRRHRRRYRLVPRHSGDQPFGEWMPGPAPGSRIA